MKLSTTVISLVTFFSVVSAVNVGYDSTYDNAEGSLTTVACSDGENGMITKGFTTFGSLPTFPNIGAAQAVGGWNSTACGTCWQILYEQQSITVIAIDRADNGFVVSRGAMNSLTNGQAQNLGIINAQATQVDKSNCKL